MLGDLYYEPLPPTILYQRVTREGQCILYFVPAEQPAGDGESVRIPLSSQSPGVLPRQDAGSLSNRRRLDARRA